MRWLWVGITSLAALWVLGMLSPAAVCPAGSGGAYCAGRALGAGVPILLIVGISWWLVAFRLPRRRRQRRRFVAPLDK